MSDICNQIVAEINRENIIKNLHNVKSLNKNAEIIAVIKADGYGHGAVPLAKLLSENGVSFFAVSCFNEAVELRQNGIEGKILILGYTDPLLAQELADNNILQAVFSYDYAKSLSENLNGKNLSAHIKLNTGMNRLGFNACNENPTDEIIKALNLKGLVFDGIFTHFAAADRSGDQNGEFTKLQYDRFIKVKNELKSHGYIPNTSHISNSAASVLNTDMTLDAVRLGIILYGLTPDRALNLPIPLYPAMSLKATVSMVHTIKKGEKVSYGLTFEAQHDMLLATVTAGYADGYPHFLSNKGKMIIGGEFCPIIGKICMDQTIVDVTQLKSVKPGDTAILIGSDNGKSITADDIAEIGDTINYEITCSITRRVPRVYL